MSLLLADYPLALIEGEIKGEIEGNDDLDGVRPPDLRWYERNPIGFKRRELISVELESIDYLSDECMLTI